jgi:hypothetical protein
MKGAVRRTFSFLPTDTSKESADAERNRVGAFGIGPLADSCKTGKNHMIN